MLFVRQWVRFDDNVLLRPVLDVVQRNEFSAPQSLRRFRIDAHGDFLAVEHLRHLLDFLLNLIADRLARLGLSRPVAVRTWAADRAFKRRLGSFASNGDKTEIVELKNF